MKESAEMGGTRQNLNGRDLRTQGSRETREPEVWPDAPSSSGRGSWETASHLPGMRVQPFPW